MWKGRALDTGCWEGRRVHGEESLGLSPTNATGRGKARNHAHMYICKSVARQSRWIEAMRKQQIHSVLTRCVALSAENFSPFSDKVELIPIRNKQDPCQFSGVEA